jgi:hypothetical protein
MQQASWRRPAAPEPEQQAGPDPAHPHRPSEQSAPEPPSPNGVAPAGARTRVWAAYQAQLAAGRTPTGAGLARAAGVSERYGQRLLAEFTADPTPAGHSNGNRPAEGRQSDHNAEGR